MGFLYFNIAVCVLDTLLFVLLVINTVSKFKQRYPNVKIPKTNWSSLAMSILRVTIMGICPIYNIFILFRMVLFTDDLIEEVIEKTYKKFVGAE